MGKIEFVWRLTPFWIKQFFSDARAHKDAFEEVFVVTIVSLVPLLLLAVVDQLRVEHSNAYAVLWGAISSGQLYLYSFALLGMLCWLCWKDHENLERFPLRKYLALIAFVCSALIVSVYSFDPALSKTLSPPLVRASVVVYVIYTVLYYILLVYENLRPPSVETQLDTEADEMASKYQKQAAEQ